MEGTEVPWITVAPVKAADPQGGLDLNWLKTKRRVQDLPDASAETGDSSWELNFSAYYLLHISQLKLKTRAVRSGLTQDNRCLSEED